MKTFGLAVAAIAGSALALAGGSAPETTVELKKVHLCCGQCEKLVGSILEKAGAQNAKCDRKAKTVSFSAADEKAAQKALDALAAAGFHGDTGSKELAIKDDSRVKKGKVASLALKDVHNCCKACCGAIKGVLKKVPGYESDDVEPKKTSFTIKGDLEATDVIKALNGAGIHAKLDAPEEK